MVSHVAPDGSVVGIIVCSRRPRQKACTFCGRPAGLLCDGREKVGDVGHTRTCDNPICDRCTWSPEPGKDYCRTCAPMEERRRAEALEAR